MHQLPSPFQEVLGMRTAFARKMTVTATRGTASAVLEPSGGSITQDSRRSMRWNGTLEIPIEQAELLPTLPQDLLTPFGTTVALNLGVTLADSSEAVVPYGRFIIDGSPVALSPNSRTVTLTLVDLADRPAKYRFESPLRIPAGTDLASAINTVMINRLGVSPGLADTGSVLARPRIFGLDPDLDPWRECEQLATDFGYRIWYDRAGNLVLDQNPIFDPLNAVPYPGPLTVEGGFESRPPNVIVARGEASDDTPPVQAVVMDDDSTSPTYAGASPGSSPYGRITEYYVSPLITTVNQARLAGEKILAGIAASAATWNVARPYDPTVDADDLLQIPLDAETSLPLAVDAVTVNLRGETTLACRALSQIEEAA